MLVIFDCDGVLLDSETLALRVMAEHLRRAGFELDTDDLLARYVGLTDEQALAAIEEDYDRLVPDEFLATYKADLDRRLPDVQVIPGAHEVLDLVDGARCICSNSSSHRLAISLRATGLYDRFRPYIFSAPEVGTKLPKPAPDVYLHAARVLDVPPTDTIVIEDSVAGVTGAAAAGMRVIGFVGGSHVQPEQSEALMDAGAATVIRRLLDVPSVIEALREWHGID